MILDLKALKRAQETALGSGDAPARSVALPSRSLSDPSKAKRMPWISGPSILGQGYGPTTVAPRRGNGK